LYAAVDPRGLLPAGIFAGAEALINFS